MIITAKELKAHGACSHGLRNFRELFGEGGEITREHAERWWRLYGGFRLAVALMRPEARQQYYYERSHDETAVDAFLAAAALHDKLMRAMG